MTEFGILIVFPLSVAAWIGLIILIDWRLSQ